ncbi:MAG: radical SAM protein [Methanomassiliicoccales archaeon]
MAIYRITFSREYGRVSLYNWGCNFSCKGCCYSILSIPNEKKIPLERVKKVLLELNPTRVHFLGGEPTTNPDLPELARFCHEELRAYTKIGHSNGSNMPPRHIDAVSVSIKAITDEIHREYTGASNARVLDNFMRMYERGIKVDASSVYIPGYIDCDEIERIAKFISAIDPEIPYHIVGYVPVPGSQWRNPLAEEVQAAARVARKYLSNVTFSCLTRERLLDLRSTDPRFKSAVVA